MFTCPYCGHIDPFIRSWFDPEREVCEYHYAKEWDPELTEQLLKEKTIRKIMPDNREYVYHITKNKSIQRWLAWDWDHRNERKPGYYDAKTGRKNYHLLGQRLARRGRVEP